MIVVAAGAKGPEVGRVAFPEEGEEDELDSESGESETSPFGSAVDHIKTIT